MRGGSPQTQEQHREKQQGDPDLGNGYWIPVKPEPEVSLGCITGARGFPDVFNMA